MENTNTKEDLPQTEVLANAAAWLKSLPDDVTLPYFSNGAFKNDCLNLAEYLQAIAPPEQHAIEYTKAFTCGHAAGWESATAHAAAQRHELGCMCYQK